MGGRRGAHPLATAPTARLTRAIDGESPASSWRIPCRPGSDLPPAGNGRPTGARQQSHADGDLTAHANTIVKVMVEDDEVAEETSRVLEAVKMDSHWPPTGRGG